MRVKTIGRGRGGHPCGPNPYSSWFSSINTLNLVKLLQVKKEWFWWLHRPCKRDTEEHGVCEVRPARRTSFWWRACPKVSLYTPPSWQKSKIWVSKAGIHGRIFSVPSRSGGLDWLVLPLRFRMVIIDVIENATNQFTALSTVGHFGH